MLAGTRFSRVWSEQHRMHTASSIHVVNALMDDDEGCDLSWGYELVILPKYCACF